MQEKRKKDTQKSSLSATLYRSNRELYFALLNRKDFLITII